MVYGLGNGGGRGTAAMSAFSAVRNSGALGSLPAYVRASLVAWRAGASVGDVASRTQPKPVVPGTVLGHLLSAAQSGCDIDWARLGNDLGATGPNTALGLSLSELLSAIAAARAECDGVAPLRLTDVRNKLAPGCADAADSVHKSASWNLIRFALAFSNRGVEIRTSPLAHQQRQQQEAQLAAPVTAQLAAPVTCEASRARTDTRTDGGCWQPSASFPLTIQLDLAARLTQSERGRLACVSRGWRIAMADPALWTALDITPGGGVRTTDKVLARLAAKARGGLHTLSVSTGGYGPNTVSHAALLRVVRTNAPTLRHLRLLSDDESGDAAATSVGGLAELLAAAPGLLSCTADVECTIDEARALLRGGVVRVRRLKLSGGWPRDTEEARRAFFDAVASHASVTQLSLSDARLGPPEGVAHLLRPFTSVSLSGCRLGAPHLPALAALLAGPLAQLSVWNSDVPLRPDAAVCAAVRASRTLTALTWASAGDIYHGPWSVAGAGYALVEAATVRARLSESRRATS